MTLALASHAFAAIAYTLLLLGVWWWQRRQPRTQGQGQGQGLFIAVVLVSVVWAWAGVVALCILSPALGRVVATLDLLRIAAWQVFCLYLLRGPAGQPVPVSLKILRWVVAIHLVAALALTFSPYALDGFLPWARNLPLLSMVSPILGLLLIEQLLRSADETRWQVKPLSLALATIYVFDLYLNSQVLLFGRFDEDSLLARAAVHALPAPLLYVAAQRRFAGSTPLQLSRNAALHTATLLFAGVYLLGISAIGYYVRYFGGEWGRVLALTLLCAALIFLALLVFSGSLRARARVFIGKHFFRYRYDYRVEWLRLTSMLTGKDSPEEVGLSVIKGLGALLHCRGGELWLRDADDQHLVQSVRWNMVERGDRLALDSDMARALVEREWILDLNENRGRADSYEGMAVPEWLGSDASSWLVIPLIVGEQLIGLVVLSQSNSSLRLNWEVRDLLKVASRQAAGFLALMRATEALLDARKFEAFNRMSAFVVHDLKNIVAQLSLMMQNARRLKDNPEFQEDMLSTVENSLEKMRRLMLQLREGATPVGVATGVPLAPIVRRMQHAARSRGRDLELDLQADVATRGHTERLERVIGHLIDNAFDATDPSGKVSVSVSRSGSQAELTVSDTGKGMSKEFIQSRLFKPFQSTKQQGMGIGAYESFEYIKELGGDLKVESIEGQGTTIKVSLPLLDLRRDSDLGLKAS